MNAPAVRHQRRNPLNDTGFILVATVVVFSSVLGASFQFDDFTLFSDPRITSSSGWWSLWHPLQTRPLTYVSFWFNYQLGGRSPVGYHIVNLALHLTVVWMLNYILIDVVGRKAAVIATVIFAIHPIQTEPVAYVWSRAILLATAFCLFSLSAWLRGRYVTGGVWFALALLSKEECVTFPVFLLFLKARPVLPVIGLLGMSAAATVRVLIAVKYLGVGGAGDTAGISPLDYLCTQGTVVLRYLKVLVVPYGLTFDPDIAVIRDWRGWMAWILVLSIATILWNIYRHGWWFTAALVLLVPSSTIFPASDLAADRRLYLPMVAFSTLVGLLFAELRHARMVVTPVILTLAVISFVRTQVWLTERALWGDAVKWAPKKVRPLVLLARASDTETALRLLTVAEEIAPRDPRPFIEKGARLMGIGLPDLALAEFNQALVLTPNDPMVLNNRGAALAELGRREDAIADFSAALAIDPCWSSARANLQSAGITYPLPCESARNPASTTGRLIY